MCGVTLFEITDDQIVAGRLHLEEVGRDVAGIEQAVEGLSGAGAAVRGRRATWPIIDRVAERASSFALTGRIGRASGQRNLASGGQAPVGPQHRRARRPTAASGSVTPQGVGGRHRDASIDGITLSDGEGQRRTRTSACAGAGRAHGGECCAD